MSQPDDDEEEGYDEYEELSELDVPLRKETKDAADELEEESKHEDDDEETNYYKENIFNKEDYYLYRAVMYFYCGEYDKAIQDFESSSSVMHANKVLYPRNQFPDDESGDVADDNGS